MSVNFKEIKEWSLIWNGAIISNISRRLLELGRFFE